MDKTYSIQQLSTMLGIPPEENLEDVVIVVKGINGKIIAEKSIDELFEGIYKLPIDLKKVR